MSNPPEMHSMFDCEGSRDGGGGVSCVEVQVRSNPGENQLSHCCTNDPVVIATDGGIV